MISREEWVHYFKRVLATREYSDTDIMEELDAFLENKEMFTFQVPPLAKQNTPTNDTLLSDAVN